MATAQLAKVIGRQDGRALAVGSAAGPGARAGRPQLAADPQRNNAFTHADDPKGLRVPRGAHIRRSNPRDSLEDTIADVKRHRIVRCGMRYGPELPDGIGEDGVDRGAAFLIIGASITRQFEFLQRVWVNNGDLVGLGTEKDPLIGANDGTGTFTIPRKPFRWR